MIYIGYQGVAIADTKVVEPKKIKQLVRVQIRTDYRYHSLDAVRRKDPPFDTEYIYATYILERARR